MPPLGRVGDAELQPGVALRVGDAALQPGVALILLVLIIFHSWHRPCV